ncbi:hypothetical protein VTN02DRAFT_5889 [Thermoascus thermophilus]
MRATTGPKLRAGSWVFRREFRFSHGGRKNQADLTAVEEECALLPQRSRLVSPVPCDVQAWPTVGGPVEARSHRIMTIHRARRGQTARKEGLGLAIWPFELSPQVGRSQLCEACPLEAQMGPRAPQDPCCCVVNLRGQPACSKLRKKLRLTRPASHGGAGPKGLFGLLKSDGSVAVESVPPLESAEMLN